MSGYRTPSARVKLTGGSPEVFSLYTRPKPNWAARMGPDDVHYHIHLKRGPNMLARFMWRVFFNVHWSRIEEE